MIIIPSIDIREGRVVRLQQGDYSRQLNYHVDPIATAVQFAAAGASFGTYSILWQMERCRTLTLPYLYLGYWIAQSRKMTYKATFRPIEGLIGGTWRRLP